MPTIKRLLKPGLTPQSGFTLIETMMTITIMGVLVSISVLSMGAIDSHTLARETDRLQLALQRAADQALFENTLLGVRVEKDHYTFYRLSSSGEWTPLNEGLLAPYHLKDAIILSSPNPLPTMEAELPQQLFYNGGTYDPFSFQLRMGKHQRWVAGDGLSRIEIVTGDTHAD